MPAEAERVHGLSEAFLADKPLFAEKAGEFLEFIGDAPMVAHNAGFDFGFINAELTAAGLNPSALIAWSIRSRSHVRNIPARKLARRSVHALWHRSQPPYQARRPA
jgi:DNA polymerase III epsilon subunit-like protein